VTVCELADAAADVLAWRGYFDLDDIPAGLLSELAELAGEGLCDFCPGPMCPDNLADHWLNRKQQEWERTIPTWTCGCGRVYKVLQSTATGGGDDFYEAVEDGLLGDPAGCIAVDSKGRVKHSDVCRGCGIKFAQTVALQSGRLGELAKPRGQEGAPACQPTLF
jgi:hypothetical protein